MTIHVVSKKEERFKKRMKNNVFRARKALCGTTLITGFLPHNIAFIDKRTKTGFKDRQKPTCESCILLHMVNSKQTHYKLIYYTGLKVKVKTHYLNRIYWVPKPHSDGSTLDGPPAIPLCVDFLKAAAKEYFKPEEEYFNYEFPDAENPVYTIDCEACILLHMANPEKTEHIVDVDG